MKRNAVELAKLQIQIDLTRRCVEHSKVIVTANAFKQTLRNAKFFASRLPFRLPNEDLISELNKEADIRIFELKRYISSVIKMLLSYQQIYDVHVEDLFWFSSSNLKTGYVLLYPNEYTTYATHVLFLVKVVDPFDGTLLYPGTIKPFKQVNHFLNSTTGLSEKELGIGFRYASKSELLEELSNLQSTIKSIKR